MIGHRNNYCFEYCSCVFQTAHCNSYLEAEKWILSITMNVLSRAVFIYVQDTRKQLYVCSAIHEKMRAHCMGVFTLKLNLHLFYHSDYLLVLKNEINLLQVCDDFFFWWMLISSHGFLCSRPRSATVRMK
jgi:hypothetical protein